MGAFDLIVPGYAAIFLYVYFVRALVVHLGGLAHTSAAVPDAF